MSQPSAVELFRLAMAASRAGDKAKTRDCLREAVRLDPSSETSWQWLAAVLDDPAEATAAWERVLHLNPGNEKAKAGIRPVRLQAGIAAAKAKDLATARRLLRAAVADEPRCEHGWLWLAGVCESPTEARAHLERVLSINPESAAARKGMAYYDAKIAKQQVAAQKSGDVTPPMTPGPVLEGEVGTRRVLVVDPSRTYRKLITMVLSEGDYEVTDAEDVDEAIDQIRDAGVPDLIVLDSYAGGMDPHDFCRLLRQHPETQAIPVALLTTGDAGVGLRRARAAGATVALAKPLDPDEFLTMTRRLVRLSPTPVA